MLFITVYLLSIMPVATPQMPNPHEFTLQNVTFSSIVDCDAAGRKWMSDLTTEAYSPNDKKHRAMKWGRPSAAPADATVTFSCIERAN
jgi:hypothetical protein